MQHKLKSKAVSLRRQGKTYSEILYEVPVAKSTLSIWLRSVGLSKKQIQRLTEKKRFAALRGANVRRLKRLDHTKQIKNEAYKEVSRIQIDKQNLWLMGTMLYWAEGDKEKDYRSGATVGFSNSDPFMIKFFLNWLRKSLMIQEDRISFRIYLHENNKHRISEIKQHWAKHTGFSIDRFDKITLKRHKINSYRKNIGSSYYGLVSVRVSKSTDLNRRISGWIEAIVKQCPVV